MSSSICSTSKVISVSVCLCICYLYVQVKLSVFFNYLRSLTWYMAFLILLFNVLSSGLSVGSNFWLAAWSDREGTSANISGAETYVQGGKGSHIVNS